ncbi:MULTISPECIES: TMAO reductase system periplasmic protein TorT [unclassified Vibrio]|uniref:TMAO reductase system periplasmic protein TorT n=1 Tax=unclassified Vibrio TaxID=2614977 RepID=UPI000B8E30D1|nr:MULTISPECIES: TMAO reductase system periplasmic protein TorT [unclassified Vibrio]NAX17966.1 TMAO reductase system periplasmic protein TorT [Vibrio sp. V22_P2S10T140]PSD41043.1 TMAO reductase system periplasmic protein TorT [Vibrio sp. V02_P2A34T13]
MQLILNLISPTLLLLILSLVSSTTFAEPHKKVCALYPHLKDSYWLSVNYGMVDEARKQKLNLRVLESGGYPNHERQKEQLSLCVRWGADAIILGTVAPDLYSTDLSTYVASTPVFATVNQLILNQQQAARLQGQVGVDWYWMGYYAGKYLADKHPQGSGKTNIALLLGPKTSGGTQPVSQGFYRAIQDSDINVVESLWADNDKELQRNLVQQALERADLRYIVGSAVAIEAAISELRTSGMTNHIGLVATYLSHGVYRGLLRGRVEFAPTDKMVEQGRLSIQQAAAFFNQQPYEKKAAPIIESLTPISLNPQIIADSLSPSEYRPTFSVKEIE